jgi:mannose/cellobiose epimerase-like protein (N-acyl-D-glucosamine 2-epimerase family)
MYLSRQVSHSQMRPGDGNIFTLGSAGDYTLGLLFEDILPLWSTIGVDRVRGGFCESIDEDWSVPDVARRVRVSARQLYVFSEAARLGFNPTVASVYIRHAARFLEAHSNEDGFINHRIEPDGSCPEAGHDLYDQAFLLFAWASAYRHLGDTFFRQRALDLLKSVRLRFAHPAGGFIDRTDKPFPLRANPHMHLLEAALAWMEIDRDPAWRRLADEMVALFQAHFFDPMRGVVREMFDANWSVIEEGGRCRIEPGHNFEWAWLLMRWETATGGKAGAAPQAMIDFAEIHGHDPVRHVAINECWDDGLPCDRTARLWPQTERLKAWLAVADASSGIGRLQAEANALDAARGLLSYLGCQSRGLWHDIMLEDGSFKAGSAPASSLYHIICALAELVRYVQITEEDGAQAPEETTPAFIASSAMELSA